MLFSLFFDRVESGACSEKVIKWVSPYHLHSMQTERTGRNILKSEENVSIFKKKKSCLHVMSVLRKVEEQVVDGDILL